MGKDNITDSFLEKIRNATNKMGDAPYDDDKTFKVISEATLKTIKYCEELKNIKKDDQSPNDLDEFFLKQMQNDEFRKEYEALTPEYEIIKMLLYKKV